MAEGNGTEWRASVEKRLAELERDNKILLRAQVLQGDQLSNHDETLTRIEKALEAAVERGRAIDERFAARGKAMDERIDKLVSAIAALVRKIEGSNSSV